MTTTAPLVWLITGTTSGVGLALLKHVLSRGDKVIASGRKIEQRLADLRAEFPASQLALLELDITAGRNTLAAKAAEAWNAFGHIDIVLNNAGISAMSSTEEASEEFITQMFTVNFSGPVSLTQSLLPYLRSHVSSSANPRRRPIIAFTSSSSAWTPLPFMGFYNASKAALSAYVESLHKEISPLGIDAVAFELGGCPTHLGQPREQDQSSLGAAALGQGMKLKEIYGPGLQELVGMFMSDVMAYMPGDLEKVASTVVSVLLREEEERKGWAVRVVLGSDAHDSIRVKCEEMIELLGRWKEVSWGTDQDGVKGGAEKKYLEAVSILKKKY